MAIKKLKNYKTDAFMTHSPFHFQEGYQIQIENRNKNCSHTEIDTLAMNYPAASCGVSKVATSTYNPICYTALFPLRFYRLFYNFSPAPVLSHTCL